MKPTIAELAARQMIGQTGLDAHSRATMGMPFKRLNGHLEVASRLLQNDSSVLRNSKVRAWLYRQAEASGRTREEVDGVIAQVLAAPSPEAMVARYATALSGDPTAAQRGLGLVRSYTQETVSDAVNTRLNRQTEQLRKSNQTFELPDDGRMKAAREESGSLRRALETAATSSGIIADRPQSLQAHQLRAQAYAHRAADKLEDNARRREAGQAVSLRDDVEASFMTAKALHAKNEVGLSRDSSISDITERADAANSVAESAMEGVERL
jgi:hypothetical protein